MVSTGIIIGEEIHKNTSVTLGNNFDGFIDTQIKKGCYGSTSEAIPAGLRLQEEREVKFVALRSALIDGEKSGVADYSYESLIEELDNE